MKNKMFFLMLAVSMVAFGAQAQAVVPGIDGAIVGTEWNAGNPDFSRYLRVTDGADAGILPGSKAFDIDAVTLAQVIDFPAQTDNGIYLLVETIATPSMDSLPGGAAPFFTLQADFNGDGFDDIIFTHSKDVFGGNVISWVRPSTSFLGGPAAGTCLDETNSIAAGCHVSVGSVIEYFFETTTGGTPHQLFPLTFTGTIRSQDGTDSPDDSVTGKFPVVPEPSTMMLFGGALLGVLGASRFRK